MLYDTRKLWEMRSVNTYLTELIQSLVSDVLSPASKKTKVVTTLKNDVSRAIIMAIVFFPSRNL